MSERRQKTHFKRNDSDPAPLVHSEKRLVNFREVDGMGIMWHGHYVSLFEEIATEARRACGLTYQTFIDERLGVPIVQCHLDYRRPLELDEVCTLKATLVWSEAARINTEYEIRKEDGTLAATGYTVQLFIDAITAEPLFAVPPLVERMQQRWRDGEFRDMQQ